MLLFNRECNCNIGDIFFTTENTIDGKGLTINWSYDINSYDAPAELTLEIYNISDDVLKNIKQLHPVVFSFGYDKNIQTFFSGFIDTYEISKKGIDKIFKAVCIEQDALIFKNFSVSYNAETDAKYIIEDLLKRSGLSLKQLELKENKKYNTGFCVYGKPINEIREIVSDCGSKLKIEGKDVYIYINDVNKNEAVLLDYTSGLLEEPESTLKAVISTKDTGEKENDTLYTHEVKALAIPLIKKNSIVIVQGDNEVLNGQVIEMSISNYEAVYKVKDMGAEK
ncbi:MAG: hypothetical protein ACRC0F_04100 [Cetobacterium sp.]